MTVKRKKRKVRRSIKIILFLFVFLFVGIVTLSFVYKNLVFLNEESVNDNASKYMTNTCLAFYPSGVSKAKDVARNICRDINERTVFDYEETVIGNYRGYRYSSGDFYLVDKDGKEPKIENVSEKGQMMISDYLRYNLKKNNLDYAYTSKCMEETYYTNITSDRYSYSFDDKNIILHFNEYGIDVEIPLNVIGAELGMDVGEVVTYKKPSYVNPDRPAIALTFDDGVSTDPNATQKLIDELYKYDANATFYVVGYTLGDKSKEIIKDSIEKGNEYGSHTLSHPNLKKLSTSEMYSQVMDIATWFKEEFNYDMTTYRPPGGAYNSTVDETIPLAAVLWDLDTEDWRHRDASRLNEYILKHAYDKAVLLMHDIHLTTIEGMVDYGAIKSLIDKGYQLVTIDELAKLRGVELKQGVHLCWGD